VHVCQSNRLVFTPIHPLGSVMGQHKWPLDSCSKIVRAKSCYDKDDV
jgi:hypothetical protein